MLRERAHLWWACVKANKEDVNNGRVETCSKFEELFLDFTFTA